MAIHFDFKKILISFLALLIFLLPIQQQKANAFNPALAIPAGIEIGAGAYVAGALALAGIAGVIGYDQYSDEINAHAKEVWADANDLAKESIRVSVETAVNAGSSTIELGKDFLDWYTGTFVPSLTSKLRATYTGSLLGHHTTVKKGNNMVVATSGDKSMNLFSYPVGSSLTKFEFQDVAILYESIIYFHVYSEVDGSFWYRSSSRFSMDLSSDVPSYNIDNYAEQVAKNLDKVLNHAKSDGISIPFGDVTALTGNLGLPLNWDTDGQVYKLPDGSIYNPAVDGGLTWGYPIPRVVTNEDGTVVVDQTTGLPVTEVTTGDGVIADPITTTFPIPETLVPVDPNAPPVSDKPGDINWRKLLDALGDFTYVFPFSIPWDIGRAVESLFGGLTEGEVPVFTWVLKGETFEIHIPDFIQSFVPFSRAIMVIVFDISIIYAIRKWFGGAT